LDLNQFLPAQYNGSNAEGVWQDPASGTIYVVGYADNATTGNREAVMWVNGPGVNLITSPAAPADCSVGVRGALTYSVRLLNARPVAPGPVTLTAALPGGGVATFASSIPPPTTVTSTQLPYALGPLAASGAFTDVSIVLTAVGAGASASITATAAT